MKMDLALNNLQRLICLKTQTKKTWGVIDLLSLFCAYLHKGLYINIHSNALTRR